jgi:NitT/TauT family transport system substrate-binding protein
MRVFLGILIFILSLAAFVNAQERRRIRISNATLSYSALPLVAAREWKLFYEQGLDVEIILMRSAAAAAALVSGDLDYQSGIGPASISATLSGVDSRALWSSTSHITYWLMAKPQYKSVQELKNKKIGVSGLGGTSHVAMTVALEKSGLAAKDYVAVSLRAAIWFNRWTPVSSMRRPSIRRRCSLLNGAGSCGCSISARWSKWLRADSLP